MPYVQRDAQGVVVAASLAAGGDDQEWLDAEAPELQAFLGRLRGAEMPEAMSQLVLTDQGLIRVLEDLVDTLIARDLIHFTDLPEAAQKKLLERRSLRDSVNTLNLIREDDTKLI